MITCIEHFRANFVQFRAFYKLKITLIFEHFDWMKSLLILYLKNLCFFFPHSCMDMCYISKGHTDNNLFSETFESISL